jgi:hypothetical protein
MLSSPRLSISSSVDVSWPPVPISMVKSTCVQSSCRRRNTHSKLRLSIPAEVQTWRVCQRWRSGGAWPLATAGMLTPGLCMGLSRRDQWPQKQMEGLGSAFRPMQLAMRIDTAVAVVDSSPEVPTQFLTDSVTPATPEQHKRIKGRVAQRCRARSAAIPCLKGCQPGTLFLLGIRNRIPQCERASGFPERRMRGL